MTPSPGPIAPQHAGFPSRVIQGFFPGGRPRILQASPAPAASARPVSAPAPLLSGRPGNGSLQPALRPGQPLGPILPTKAQPGALQPATPVRPQVPQPILPKNAAAPALQPHSANASALPANFALKPRGSGQPLPEAIQKKMESFFNTSFADVRVHVGNEAPSIGAWAFAHGSDLYFAPGQYNPQSTHGQQLLGHELTHVVQQRAGRVRNPLGTGVAVVQDPALEAEAERMALRVASTAAPIQAKLVGNGAIEAPSLAPVVVTKSNAANGAILPARSLGSGSVQRKPGPILPEKSSNPESSICGTQAIVAQCRTTFAGWGLGYGRVLQPIFAGTSHSGSAQQRSTHRVGSFGRVIQRRKISDDLFTVLDPKKEAEASLQLLKVAKQEDEANALIELALVAIQSLEQLKDDEFVGQEATGHILPLASKKNTLTVRKEGIAKGVNWMENMFKDKMTAILELEKYTSLNNWSKKKITEMQKLRGTKEEAQEKWREQFKVGYLVTMPGKVQVQYDLVVQECKEIMDLVNGVLTKQQATKQAKAAYAQDLQYVSQNDTPFLKEASRLEILPPYFSKNTLEQFTNLAQQKQWMDARKLSLDYIDELKQLGVAIQQRQQALKHADKQLSNLQQQISVQQPDQKVRISNIQSGNQAVALINSETQSLNQEIRNLNQEIQNLTQPKQVVDLSLWTLAIKNATTCISGQAKLERLIVAEESLVSLCKKQFLVKTQAIVRIDLIQIVKRIQSDYPNDSAVDIDTKITNYCTEIGRFSKDTNLVVTAVDKGLATNDLHQLTGSVALIQFINKGKSVARSNEIQESHEKLSRLERDDLDWLLGRPQPDVTIERGETFLMTPHGWAACACGRLNQDHYHRKYKLVTAEEGIKTKNRLPEIHVHWCNLNVTIGKAHTIPDSITHAGPNPVANDIPNADALKAKIVAAGAAL